MSAAMSAVRDEDRIPTWQRRTNHYRPRREAWCEWASGGALRLPTSAMQALGDRPSVCELLAACAALPEGARPETLYLTGGATEDRRPDASWYAAAADDGWSVRYAPRQHSGSATRGGYTVDLRQTAAWYGAEERLARVMPAHGRLALELRRAFGPLAYVLPTPAQTGRDLLQMTLPGTASYPVLPAELRELLVHTNTQGRVEVCTLDDVRTVERIHTLDARFMYAACVSNLPTGPARLDSGDEFLGYGPAFYELEATVPADWAHIGLLPYRPAGAEVTAFPATPGVTFRTWAGGPEVGLARQHGWQMRILRRLWWPERSSKPLDAWALKLRDARAQLGVSAARGDRDAALVGGVLRHLLIDTIGSLHRSQRYAHGIVPHDRMREKPPGARVRVRGDGIHWYQTTETVYPWTHPEWSAMVWSRTRARLATAALQLPRESILALRTDAIYTTHDPRWPDDGKPGAWRIKATYDGPRAAPHSNAAVIELSRGSAI